MYKSLCFILRLIKNGSQIGTIEFCNPDSYKLIVKQT